MLRRSVMTPPSAPACLLSQTLTMRSSGTTLFPSPTLRRSASVVASTIASVLPCNYSGGNFGRYGHQESLSVRFFPFRELTPDCTERAFVFPILKKIFL